MFIKKAPTFFVSVSVQQEIAIFPKSPYPEVSNGKSNISPNSC